MADLPTRIRDAVLAERFTVGRHAAMRLRQRRIVRWQVQAGMEHAVAIRTRPDDLPHPVVEWRHLLPDGTPVHAVWSWVESSGEAKLVTVHFLDRGS